jgi:hypothetical protein
VYISIRKGGKIGASYIHKNNSSWGELSVERTVCGVNCTWGELSMGRTVHGANCPSGELSMGRTVHGANCPWGELSMGRTIHGANCPWGELSWGELSWGEFWWDGASFDGASFDGASFDGRVLMGQHPSSETTSQLPIKMFLWTANYQQKRIIFFYKVVHRWKYDLQVIFFYLIILFTLEWVHYICLQLWVQ